MVRSPTRVPPPPPPPAPPCRLRPPSRSGAVSRPGIWTGRCYGGLTAGWDKEGSGQGGSGMLHAYRCAVLTSGGGDGGGHRGGMSLLGVHSRCCRLLPAACPPCPCCTLQMRLVAGEVEGHLYLLPAQASGWVSGLSGAQGGACSRCGSGGIAAPLIALPASDCHEPRCSCLPPPPPPTCLPGLCAQNTCRPAPGAARSDCSSNVCRQGRASQSGRATRTNCGACAAAASRRCRLYTCALQPLPAPPQRHPRPITTSTTDHPPTPPPLPHPPLPPAHVALVLVRHNQVVEVAHIAQQSRLKPAWGQRGRRDVLAAAAAAPAPHPRKAVVP